jgi:lysophospholipase-3
MGLLYKYEFGPMIDHLTTSFNYTLGVDLFIAPYDWRLAGDSHARATNGVGGFYKQLQTLIEQSVQRSQRKAVVLSHSLGCPTILYFFHNYVSENWRAKYIQGWLALSGPWLGATMQVNAYLSGWNLGEPSFLVPHDYVKPVQVNASSGVWLSPSPLAFGNDAIVTTPTKNYTASDLPALISLIGEQAGGEQALNLQRKLSGDLPSLQRPPANVAVYNWYSTGIKTSERYEYSKEITRGFNEAPMRVHYGDGDGIVNHVSAKAIENQWSESENPTFPVVTQVFPGASHFGILSDKRVLEALATYLGSIHAPSATLESRFIV